MGLSFTLKAIVIVAAVTFATGDGLPVILISLLFNVVELGAKPVGQTAPRDIVIVSSNDDAAADFHAATDSERTHPNLKTM